MYIGEPAEIMEFMQHFMNLCSELEVLLDQTWKSFILGNFKEGMSELTNVFTYLEQMINQAQILKGFKNVRINSTDIIQKLGELESAMAIPDYILTADLIKYEIKPVIITWRKSVWTAMKRFI